jgi:hypothetical protein
MLCCTMMCMVVHLHSVRRSDSSAVLQLSLCQSLLVLSLVMLRVLKMAIHTAGAVLAWLRLD